MFFLKIDDLARTVKEVDKICGEINDQTPLPVKLIDTSSKLLSVQHKNLNPSNEMKRLFGSRVVQSEKFVYNKNFQIFN